MITTTYKTLHNFNAIERAKVATNLIDVEQSPDLNVRFPSIGNKYIIPRVTFHGSISKPRVDNDIHIRLVNNYPHMTEAFL